MKIAIFLIVITACLTKGVVETTRYIPTYVDTANKAVYQPKLEDVRYVFHKVPSLRRTDRGRFELIEEDIKSAKKEIFGRSDMDMAFYRRATLDEIFTMKYVEKVSYVMALEEILTFSYKYCSK